MTWQQAKYSGPTATAEQATPQTAASKSQDHTQPSSSNRQRHSLPVTTEHTFETPIYKGALARAVNATDGTELWTLSAATGEFTGESYAIADGYSVFFNSYDQQIYSLRQRTKPNHSSSRTKNIRNRQHSCHRRHSHRHISRHTTK